MKVSQISFEETNVLSRLPFTDPHYLEIGKDIGTDGCLLDCRNVALQLDANFKHAGSPSKRREKRKEIRAVAKRISKQQNEETPQNKNVAMDKLWRERGSFDLADLETSAANGCECCNFFGSLLKAALPLCQNIDISTLKLQWFGFQFILEAQHLQPDQSFALHFFTPSLSEATILGLRPANLLSGDTSSTVSLDKAKGWIQDCEKLHEKCGPGRNSPLPKRCLDLGPLGTPTEADLKLAETEGNSGTYVCLTHCWGTDPAYKPLQTFSATVRDHRSSIQFTSLPRTFADAVVITRKLGLRYLWIDSLCIIQDSTADWQTEAGKMASVYSGSFVTIVSISSADSRGGCFSRGVPSDLCFRVTKDNRIDTVIAARFCKGRGFVDNVEGLKARFPALTRAWIYQERILSRRILYCNHREFQFECREGNACECANQRMPPHLVSSKTTEYDRLLHLSMKYTQWEKIATDERQQSHWQKLVMQYTKLELTQTEDKLPALSGCAQDFSRMTGKNESYVAGLWQEHFAQGLLWLNNAPRLPRPSAWRAPSWSWAAVDTPDGITYIRPGKSLYREQFQNQIRKIECTLEGVDQTGGVKAGFVCLQASLYPTYIRLVCGLCGISRKRTWIVDDDRWLVTQNANENPCPAASHEVLNLGNIQRNFYPDYKYRPGDLCLEPQQDGRLCRLAKVYLLHLYDNNLFVKAIGEFFLVLKDCVQEDGLNHYERVGLLHLVFPDMKKRDSWLKQEYDVRTGVEKEITIK